MFLSGAAFDLAALNLTIFSNLLVPQIIKIIGG